MILKGKIWKTLGEVSKTKIIVLTSFSFILATYIGSYASGLLKVSDHKEVHLEFRDYVSYIYSISQGRFRVRVERIGFYKNDTNIPESRIGECSLIIPSWQPEIDIRKESWYDLTERQKVLLLAHEILHCSCKYFHHIDVTRIDGCPTHYSNGVLAGDKCVDIYYLEYLNQITQGCDGL